MALSVNTVFEVQSGASDTNGGGFVTGATGTDWSQQASAQYSVTDAVTNGTTTITSATASFGADVVGNLLYISGGTGSITGAWYEIKTRSSSTTITVDRSTGLTSGTGATLKVGGAFATIAPAVALMTISGMTLYVKAATYSISTGISTTTAASSNPITRVIGYTTTRGDKGQPTIQCSAAMTAWKFLGRGWCLQNFILDGNSGTGTIGLSFSNYSNHAINVKMMGFSSSGALSSGAYELFLDRCEVTGCAGVGAVEFEGNNSKCINSWVHDNNSEIGIYSSAITAGDIVRNKVTNNTGDGIRCTRGALVQHNTCYGNGGAGIRYEHNYVSRLGSISNNILSQNGGVGLRTTNTYSNGRPSELVDYNAFYSNTGGERSSFAAGPNDVTLTGDPFTAKGSDDYSLIATGGGAQCRGAASSPYLDIGAVQHADPAGGGNTIIIQQPRRVM